MVVVLDQEVFSRFVLLDEVVFPQLHIGPLHIRQDKVYLVVFIVKVVSMVCKVHLNVVPPIFKIGFVAIEGFGFLEMGFPLLISGRSSG